MTDAVETMAWTNEVPWHGLGKKVDSNLTSHAMMKAAGLDWRVEKRPLYTINAGTNKPSVKVKGQFALTRDIDQHVLDVVGNAYVPVQNENAFEFFKEFVEAGSATMETAGSLLEGRRVWGLANLGKSFTLPGKDEVKGYLLVSSPHEQGKAMQIMFTSVRVVCNNTLTMALARDATGSFRMAHRQKFDKSMIERAKAQLGIAREQMSEFEEASKMLSKARFDELTTVRYLAGVFEPHLKALSLDEITEKQSINLKRAREALVLAPGATLSSAKGTAWGALQAVTYTTDHVLGRTADARLNKAWFGKTAQLKRKALDDALSLIA